MEKTTTAEKAKTFYDEWIEKQQSMMQQWAKNTQQFQQTMAGAKGVENGTDYTKDFANMQKGMMQNWMNLMQQIPTGMPKNGNGNANPFNQNFMDLPTKFMENWMAMSQNMGKMPNMDAGMKDWMELPVKFMQNWATLLQGMQSNATHWNLFRNDRLNDVFKLQDTWQNINNTISGSINNTMESMTKNFTNVLSKDTFNNMFSSTGTYLKVMEFWKPFTQQIQDGIQNPQNLQKLMDMTKYKDVMDKMFNFASPESVKDFHNQMTYFVEAMNTNSQQSIQRYNQLLQNNLSLLPEMMSGDPTAAMKAMDNLNDMYQKTVEPLWHVTNQGKENQIAELMGKITNRYSDYSTKFAEFQHLVYTTGQKAMEDVMNESVQQITKGTEISNYNEFFRNWVRSNEEKYLKLFETDEFSKLQGELMTVGLEIKSDFQKVMELMLVDIPVVPRSEMDDLYKTIHDLKAKVRNLEKQLNIPVSATLETNGSAEKAAPKKGGKSKS